MIAVLLTLIFLKIVYKCLENLNKKFFKKKKLNKKYVFHKPYHL